MKHNILMIGPDPQYRGGISAVINMYFQSNLINKFNIIYLSSVIEGNKIKKILHFIKSIFLFFKYTLLKRVFVIHIHTSSGNSFNRKSIFVLLSKVLRKKVILHIHSGRFIYDYYHEGTFLGRFYIRKIICLADEIIALSNQWKRDIERIISFKKKLRIVFNPVVIPPLVKRKKSSLYDKNIKILFMGKLEEDKGIYDLIKVGERLIKKNRNVKFVICGNGEINKVRSIVKERGISQYFDILGWIIEKKRYFEESDIYILISYFEGMPVSVLEAASYGLPIIATSVGAIPELVEHGLNGYLVKPGDIEDIEKKLLKLIYNKNIRRRMGVESYNKAKKKFEANIIARQLDSLYREMLHSQ